MNVATDQIIRWHLANAGSDEAEVEDFMVALRTGVAKNETDAKLLCAGLLTAAREASRYSDSVEDIERLFVLHSELEVLTAAEKQIEAIEFRNAMHGLFTGSH